MYTHLIGHELCDVVLTIAVIAAFMALPLGIMLGMIRNGVELNRSEAARLALQERLDGYFRYPRRFYRDLQDYIGREPVLPWPFPVTLGDGAHAATDDDDGDVMN